MIQSRDTTKKVSYQKHYYQLFIGTILLILGSLMVTHAVTWEAFGLWLPFTMVLGGLLLAAGGGGAGIIIGFLMLMMGCSILLHQLDIVTVPYLKAVLGWLFIGLSILLILAGSLNILKKWKAHGKETTAKKDDDDYDPNVDY